jgi:superfamily II DNA or RNA helicase
MKTNYRSYKDAKKFVRSLGLKSGPQWRTYCKSGNKPKDIPTALDAVYKNEWEGMGEFLGTGTVASYNRNYRSYKDANKFVRSLGLKSRDDWDEYCKSGNKPKDIPTALHAVYKNEWEGMGEFLGTGTVASKDIIYLSYEETTEFVRTLGIKTENDWHTYCKSGNKPKNIPFKVERTYKNEWNGWGEFLGTGYLSYEETKEFALSLKFKSSTEWYKWSKSGMRPSNIPGSPEGVYKNKGWNGWGEFLGTGTVATQDKIYISYEESKKFARSLGFKSSPQWNEYCKSGEKPDDIPSSPHIVYKEEWNCIADFLGYIGNGNFWNQASLSVYLEEIKPLLYSLPIQFIVPFIQNARLGKYFDIEKLKRIQDSSSGSNERIKIVDDIIQNNKAFNIEENTIEDYEQILEENSKIEDEFAINQQNVEESYDLSIEGNTDLRIKELKSLDIENLYNNSESTFIEDIRFVVEGMINLLWNDTLNGKLDIKKINSECNSLSYEVPKSIIGTFIKEYNEVISMESPKGWTYQHKPLLMQKLITYRLAQKINYGNWSAVGAGKTIGAVMAGRYVGARNTLVITFNSTIGNEDQRGWTKEIRDSFKDSKIYTKIDKDVVFDDESYNYLVLNYETFQQKNSVQYVKDMIKRNKFDYVILDEVQSIKQRDQFESKRRGNISELIRLVRKSNPDCYSTFMSATPVINNLEEGKSILELLGYEVKDIDTTVNVANAMQMHRKLTLCGLRYKNVEDNILKDNKYNIVDVKADHLYSNAISINIAKNDFLAQDHFVLDSKLNTILPYINSSNGKTIIYISYVKGIEEYTYNFLITNGFKTAVYTGSQNKQSREDALTGFINGDYDVLLASKPVATGVDGLQKVSDRMIILSLPWTPSELVQLVGRINRKGSIFTEVDVIIPLVSISSGEQSFRWDYRKYNTITYKESIVNAVVDGIIPDKKLKFEGRNAELNRKRLAEEARNGIEKIQESLNSI